MERWDVVDTAPLVTCVTLIGVTLRLFQHRLDTTCVSVEFYGILVPFVWEFVVLNLNHAS